jgi:hypothetical protein
MIQSSERNAVMEGDARTGSTAGKDLFCYRARGPNRRFRGPQLAWLFTGTYRAGSLEGRLAQPHPLRGPCRAYKAMKPRLYKSSPRLLVAKSSFSFA